MDEKTIKTENSTEALLEGETVIQDVIVKCVCGHGSTVKKDYPAVLRKIMDNEGRVLQEIKCASFKVQVFQRYQCPNCEKEFNI